jgi:hypothetical protein
MCQSHIAYWQRVGEPKFDAPRGRDVVVMVLVQSQELLVLAQAAVQFVRNWPLSERPIKTPGFVWIVSSILGADANLPVSSGQSPKL